MSLFLRLFSHRFDDNLAVPRVDLDRVAIVNGALQDAAGDTVLDLLLDDALEGGRSKLRVVAHLCQKDSFGCHTSSNSTWPAGAPMNSESLYSSMYSDMSIRTMARSSSNRNSARARASSVFPTPVRPRKSKLARGRLGSCSPARARRIASATACSACSCPTTRSRRRSSIVISFCTSPCINLVTGYASTPRQPLQCPRNRLLP